MHARVDPSSLASDLAVAPDDVKASLADRLTVIFIQIVCFSGLTLANYYSWTMTVTGFVNTKLLPDNSVLPNTYIPHVVGGFMQLGIFAFYLCIPFFNRRHFVLNFLATMFAVLLIAVSAIFALFSITLTSQADNITAYQVDVLKGMNKTLVQLDELATNTFKTFLADMDSLSGRACEGKDKTGVARCGSIARGYIERANAARSKYGSQLGATARYDLPLTSEVVDLLTSLQGNRTKLSQKIEVYRRFATENELSSVAAERALATLDADIAQFSGRLNDKVPDAKTLVLNRVLGDFRKVWSGSAEPAVYFALLISLLPDLLSICFTTLLLILRTANQEAVTLRRAVRKAHEQAVWYDRYATATEALHRAKQRWRDRRRVASVAEAVDQAVPDTM